MSERISNEVIENFCAITGCNQDRAKFYLEAANGTLDLAIESFYENGGGNEPDSEMSEPAVRSTGFQVEEDDDNEDEDEDYTPVSANPFARLAGSKKPEEPKKTTRQAAASASSKIHTLSAMNNSDEEEEERGQAFYAGGSEQSGQQILGPPRKNPEKIITDLFAKAKEHGAQEVDPSEEPSTSKKPVVYGHGYRLGTGNEPSEVIPGPPRPKQKKVSVLKLWKNGFTVNDGPLRSFEDPQNKEFLNSIQRGELPHELIREADGGEVNLDMQDHRDEEFVAPKPKYVLFNTDGYKLGSPTPKVVSTASPNDQVNNEANAKRSLNLNESAPTTQLQLRLSDGSRLIIKMNHTHTVRDLRNYINTARPEYAPRVYSLMTSFPNKELTDDSETLEQGKLLNAVIIQKLQA